jgi:L-fuculose-phosphate aldolase
MTSDLALLSSADPAAALAAACRLAYARGLVAAMAGNASTRCEDGFLCTPTGCSLGEVRPEILVHCDGLWQPCAGGHPTSEWRLHAALYTASDHIGAVLHTHSPFATLLALENRSVPPLTPEAAHYLGLTPCVPFAPPGSEELARLTVTAVTPHAHAALLARHGAVAWGASPREAFFHAELLESVCTLAWRHSLGQGNDGR